MKKLIDHNINTQEYWDSVYKNEIENQKERIDLERFQRVEQMIFDGAEVLDAGCGKGEFISYLKKRKTKCKITGIDISKIAVNDAKKKYPTCNFLHMNVYNISKYFNNFDFVISFEIIEHLSTPNLFIEAAHNVLKPGGFLIITTPFDNQVYGGDEHIYSFDFQDMLNFFKDKKWQLISLTRYSTNFKNMFALIKKK